MSKKIRLVIGDYDQFLIESLSSLLRDHGEIEIVGTAIDCHGLALTTHEESPDIAIVGTDLVLANGSKLCAALQNSRPGIGLIFVGSKMDPSTMADLIFNDGGGRAFLKRNDIGGVDKLVRCIRSVADGSTLLNNDAFRRILINSEDPLEASMPNLTAKERQVLACLANADSNARIAEKLKLRSRTVENYVATIFSKLGVGRRSGRDPRVQAALYYLSMIGRLESQDASEANSATSEPFMPSRMSQLPVPALT
ncbi:MAG: response regulator transcription factor [Chloroflexi bacterium]|nr:response regulator transcription factor [Chloroflexota bacterium]